MKIRFSTVEQKSGFSRKRYETTYYAFDTQEVAAWTLVAERHSYAQDEDSTNLELWLKGVSEPIVINEKLVGTPTFQSVLTLLVSEFPDIDDLKLKTVQ